MISVLVWGDTERYLAYDSLTTTSMYDNPNFLDDSHAKWMISESGQTHTL